MENQKKDIEEITLTDILIAAIRNWKWYVISLSLCLMVAVVIIKSTERMYQREATVLIKNNNGSSQMVSESVVFSEVGLIGVSNSVENEILVFQSKRLMFEVVRRLHLDVDYLQKGYLRYWNCYAKTPVRFEFPEASEDDAFELTFCKLANGNIEIKNFSVNPDAAPIIAKPGESVQTPVGMVTVHVVPDNLDNYQGEDVIVRKSKLKNKGLLFSSRLSTLRPSDGRTSIIALVIQDESKKRAEDILNMLVTVYNEDAVRDKNRVAQKTADFIDEQLLLLEAELTDVDTRISEFKKTNQITDAATDATVFRSQVSETEQQTLALQNQRSVANYILNYVNKSGNNFDVIPNNSGISNPQVEALISQYNTEVLQREKLMQDAGLGNPQVQDLTNSIQQLRSRIVSSIQNLIQSLNLQIGNVTSYKGTSSNRLAAVPGQVQTIVSVERQQKIYESLYIYLLQKRQENGLAMSMTADDARILDHAMGSDYPVSPRVPFILVCGLVAGFLIPSILLFLLVVSDTKVRSRKDVQRVLSVPLVGEIPFSGKERSRLGEVWDGLKKSLSHGKRRHHHRERKMIVQESSRDAVSESIRILRTNLQFMQQTSTGGKVFMTTSFLAGAGKTFISTNLGMSWALAGKKVLLVDLDIRRGSLSATVNRKLPGVTNYLAGMEKNLDNLIVHTEHHENLDILPAGFSAPNPSEVLMQPALDELVDELRKRYDYIILDNVPANVVADAMIVNRVTDVTLFIIRAGNFDRRLLPEVEALKTEKKLKNIAIVLNGIGKNHTYSDYYGYYGYSSYEYK